MNNGRHLLIYLFLVGLVTNAGAMFVINLSTNYLPLEDGPFWDNVVGIAWILCLLQAVVIVIIKRRLLFTKRLFVLTLLALLLCTPFPLVLKYKIDEAKFEKVP